MEKVKYKESDVWFRECNGAWDINPHDCYCCNKPIKTGEKATLIFNNYKYIPNILVHSECFDEQKLKVCELLADIEESYNQYKMLSRVFG